MIEPIDPRLDFHAGRVGKTRTGKTLGTLIDANHFQRVLIYDTNKDFVRTLTEPKHTDSGKVIQMAPHIVVIERDLRKVVEAINKGFWQICFVPESGEDIEQFNAACRIVYQISKTLKWEFNLDFKFVVDEIWHFANKNSIEEPLKTILREGLKERLSLRWTSQRLADTHTDVVTQCRYVDVFNIWARDVKYLNELIKSVNEKTINQLGPYEFLRYDVDTRTLVQYGRLD